MKHKLFALLLCLTLLCPLSCVSTAAANPSYTVAEVENLCGGIVAYKASLYGAQTAQELIDRGLTAEAGTTGEYYAITLSQSGSYDLSRYEQALLNYLDTHEVYSATTREKYALALIACGSTDSYIRRVCDEAIGGLGLMSLVFGLHLLNNGYSSSLYDTGSLINTILSCQLSDGGWAVTGNNGDADVTAMTVQSLAPYYGMYSEVTAAIDSALNRLSQMQLGSGGYRSMGAENCESAAQVLCALSAIGIDAQQDSRFIKNGNTVLSAMLAYLCADGSFSHVGTATNENATIQAFYALRSYLRMRYGQSPYYILDRRDPAHVKPAYSSPTSAPAKKPTKKSNTSSAPDTSGHTPEYTDDEAPSQEIIYIDGREDVTAAERSSEPAAADASETQAKASPTQPTAERGASVEPSSAAESQSLAASAPATADETAVQRGGYKPYAILAVILAALIAALILYLMKKRGIKHYLAVIILAAAVILLILLTNFESAESYRTVEEKSEAYGSVTMTIRFDAIMDEDERPDYLPEEGFFLDESTFTISEGDTVYDVLLEASKKYDIPIDNRGSENSVYIAGIGYLYEYAYGRLSGWMYRVNGSFPEVGCQSYILSDGDRIEWLYSKDIGRDL